MNTLHNFLKRKTLKSFCGVAFCFATLFCAAENANAGTLEVVSTNPPAHTISVPTGLSITINFNQSVDPATINNESFWAFGRWSGTAQGTFEFSNNNQSVTLIPNNNFFTGEQVMVFLSHDIQAKAGPALRSGGYSFVFWTAAMPAAIELTQLGVLSTRIDQNDQSRAYGGFATDLNNDGWADLTIVNEVSEDLRVFLNQADGTGLFHDFIQPTFPVNTQASPNEPSDFNHDGFADVCVANIAVGTVSILLGTGDGHFAPQQQVAVGAAPRGIAVLDVDGDGDVDIVNTNATSSNLSILLNNGSGVFGQPTFFEGGGSGEWALATADMNSDGLIDLVVGARFSATMIVNLNNGDGSFSPQTPQAAGGGPWMITVGDVNGDGNEDVSTANGSSNNAAILLGNGDGTLAPSSVYNVDPFVLATDLGDIDGDGDLDWVLSSFQGDWRILTNDGAGNFIFHQEINAPSTASCALFVDIDNDRDLDLALVDETADVVLLMNNSGITPLGDLDASNSVGTSDLLILFAAWGQCDDPPVTCPADLDGDGVVSTGDLLLLLSNWG